MAGTITINEERCIHCGMCIRDCFLNLLEFDDNRHPRYVEGGAERCVGCQHCFAVCPKGALSLNGLDPDGSETPSFGNSDDLLTLIKSRRGYRSYRKEDVPKETLDKVIEMLAYPPTGASADCLHFSVVSTKKRMEEIAEATCQAIRTSEEVSPVNDWVLGSFDAGNDIVYKGAPAMIVVSIDASKAVPGCETVDPIIALSYAELYAASLGLGTLWDDFATKMLKKYPGLRSMIGVPDDHEISFVLLLGVPSIKYRRTVQKEARNITVV